MADSDTLRRYLGERIPDSGDESDTFFSNDEIDELVSDHASLFRAAAEGWRQKAGELANLVNTTELGSSRSNSDLYKAAEKQIAHYEMKADEEEGDQGVTRVHTLERGEPA